MWPTVDERLLASAWAFTNIDQLCLIGRLGLGICSPGLGRQHLGIAWHGHTVSNGVRLVLGRIISIVFSRSLVKHDIRMLGITRVTLAQDRGIAQ